MPANHEVFINCPFDKEYKPLLKGMLFILVYLDYKPLISTTKSSANIRVNEIKKLIRRASFGIHDLSRNETPRFNMPFELGLDIGCATYGTPKQRKKKILILDTTKYYFQKVLSDIGGQDIANHNNDPRELIFTIRTWLVNNNSTKKYPPADYIWTAFSQFEFDMNRELTELDYSKRDIEEMPEAEYLEFCNRWIRKFKPGN